MEACQARVRTDLAANLGEALPVALRPAAVQECRRTEDGYAVDLEQLRDLVPELDLARWPTARTAGLA